jgi:hypothetical protein
MVLEKKVSLHVIFLDNQYNCKNNKYHIVDKVQNSYENTLIFDLFEILVLVVFALYSSVNVK